MSDFEVIEELGFPRHNRQTGEAEKLVIQLTRNNVGKHFVSICHFWFKPEDGGFYPPSAKKTLIVFAGKNVKAEATALIGLLQKLVDLQPAQELPSAQIDRSKPGRGGVWSEAATGVIDIGLHRDRLGK